MSDTPQAATLCIEGEMGIYRAAELKQLLLRELQSNDALDLDLSGVTEFDAAGLQLLMLAERVAGERGIRFRLAAISDAVREVLELLQLVLDTVDAQDMPADAPLRPMRALNR